MARVHPGNLNPQVDDHETSFEHLRNEEFEKKTSDAAPPPCRRGGGRSRGGGGGRRGGGRRRRLLVDYDSSISDAVESTSGSKPLNTLSEVAKNSEPVKPFVDKSSSKAVDISPLLAKIKDLENELKLRDEENEGLCIKVKKAATELSSVQAKNEEMILNMDKLRGDLEKCRNELSSVKERETEISRMYLVMKNKFEVLEEANEAAEAEMMNMKMESAQWKKAAKAIAVVLVGGEVISSKTAELEYLVLYYSNRAAKRMSLGKMRKALDDCRIAALLDPSFLKVCLTAGNCHLELGELDAALYNYKKCLESGVVCLDQRLTTEASEGLYKAEKVVSYIKQSAELLRQKTSESATNALEMIREALSISCYSEKLLEMTAEAHFLLQNYEMVVQMCDKTFSMSENNCADNNISNEEQKRQLMLWRWRMMARSYFRMGSFDMALATLEKYEQLSSGETKTEHSSSFSVATVSELLRCKSAGNEAYKAGRHREAVEHYSKAVKMSIESRSFTAICLCNRAAAHQALGEVVDAIADCNLAIALDENYLKAIYRRANLHEKIRDYEHATLDLQRLITLLEQKSEEKYGDLIVARRRLSSMNKHLKKEMPLDLYLVLGLKGSESSAEIKKAYHKAALRHHPDKAGKFLTRCESGGDGDVWKEIFETIHMDADKLFKIIGEAYAVLSDANKRFKYNLEDAMKDD